MFLNKLWNLYITYRWKVTNDSAVRNNPFHEINNYKSPCSRHYPKIKHPSVLVLLKHVRVIKARSIEFKFLHVPEAKLRTMFFHVNNRRLCSYIYEWNVVCFLIMEFSFLPVSIINKETNACTCKYWMLINLGNINGIKPPVPRTLLLRRNVVQSIWTKTISIQIWNSYY